MNSWIILPIVTLMTVATQVVHAELKQDGTVLSYACAANENTNSQMHKVCFAQVVGDEGQFLTTEDLQGTTRAWRVSEVVQPPQIGKGGSKFERLQLQQIGIVQNNILHQTINTEVLVGRLLKLSDDQSQIVGIDGEILGEHVTASNFQTYSFTMDQQPQQL